MDKREQNGVGFFVLMKYSKNLFHQVKLRCLYLQESKWEHDNISKHYVCMQNVDWKLYKFLDMD